MDISDWLEQNGLGKYASAFGENEIDFIALPEITEDDLREMGLPIGSRRKLLKAIRDLIDTDRAIDPGKSSPATTVDAEHQKLMVTALGRAPRRSRNTKHDIKQSDRLIGNTHLAVEREALYRALSRQLLGTAQHPIIIIDWSDYTYNRSHILLRASVPVGGRALTLYEEVHALKAYGNTAVQRSFLDTLQRFVLDGVQPIVVTDAGFIDPWFAEVRARGWHYVGRIRKNLLVREPNTPQWTCCVELYAKATGTARYYGPIELTRKRPLACHLHLLRKKPKGRHKKTPTGQRSARKASHDHVVRETSPWLIVTSFDPDTHGSKRVMQLYKTRMQIELAFREFKNTRAGLALRETRSRASHRLANLLLVGMLASFCLWLVGRLAIKRGDHHRLQANTERKHKVLSVFFVACQLIVQNRLPIQPAWLNRALDLVHDDIALQSLP